MSEVRAVYQAGQKKDFWDLENRQDAPARIRIIEDMLNTQRKAVQALKNAESIIDAHLAPNQYPEIRNEISESILDLMDWLDKNKETEDEGE